MTVVIPTYLRERVLVETLEKVLLQKPEEIIVVDQTPSHDPETQEVLERLESGGKVRILRLESPSIPKAMNAGLLAARSENVLFLDDDIVPGENLLSAHEQALYSHPDAWAVVGQILQPGESPVSLSSGQPFRFNSDKVCYIHSAMAGNMSIQKAMAEKVGGFDENFVGAAYMFETEFAERLMNAGGKIFFEPAASIRHLRSPRGGTRGHGNHLTTWEPTHSVGAHYHILLRHGSEGALKKSMVRILRALRTRHHFLHPWDLLPTLVAETRGFFLARNLFKSGPRLLERERSASWD